MPTFDQILSKQSIFKDVSILSPHYIPTTLPYREAQINEIRSVVSPALLGKKPRNLFVYGKTGTGKTSSVKNVLEDFNARITKGKMFYVNCRIYNSRYRILQRVLKEFIPELEKSGFGLTFLYEKLIELISSGYQMLIVLDEIDMTKDLDELIYTLTRINDEVRNSGGVTIIGVSNKLSFKDALDPRSKSSLYETEMVFPPYTSEQLQKILEQRANQAFAPHTVEAGAINLCAAITAQECGDARYALKLFMKAGEIAEQTNKKTITDSEVEAARKRVEYDLANETIATLPENHQLVLYAIANLSANGGKYSRLDGVEEGFLFSGETYDEYEMTCKKTRKKARSLRWFKEYLNDLEMLGLITTKPSSVGVRGHTTLIRLGHSAPDILSITGKNMGIEPNVKRDK